MRPAEYRILNSLYRSGRVAAALGLHGDDVLGASSVHADIQLVYLDLPVTGNFRAEMALYGTGGDAEE